MSKLKIVKHTRTTVAYYVTTSRRESYDGQLAYDIKEFAEEEMMLPDHCERLRTVSEDAGCTDVVEEVTLQELQSLPSYDLIMDDLRRTVPASDLID